MSLSRFLDASLVDRFANGERRKGLTIILRVLKDELNAAEVDPLTSWRTTLIWSFRRQLMKQEILTFPGM